MLHTVDNLARADLQNIDTGSTCAENVLLIFADLEKTQIGNFTFRVQLTHPPTNTQLSLDKLLRAHLHFPSFVKRLNFAGNSVTEMTLRRKCINERLQLSITHFQSGKSDAR